MDARMTTRLVVVLACLWMPASAGLADVLEGFEGSGAVRSGGRTLSKVSGGAGVTEGASAVEVPPGTAVRLTVGGAVLSRNAWLRLDVTTVQPIATQVGIVISAGRGRFSRTAYGSVPSDTIALPLAVVASDLGDDWASGSVQLELTNEGDWPIILDNIRVDPPAGPPADAVLLDLGPGGQTVWPGFRPAGAAAQEIIWSGLERVYDRTSELPDPLCGDYVGQAPGDSSDDHFLLRGAGSSGSAVHLWVTHYGDRNDMPSPQYGLRIDGQTLLKRKLTPRQMLGEEGILQGMDGAWTGEWFATTYSAALVDRVSGRITGSTGRGEIVGCQLAAVAMAPLEAQRSLEDYVRQVDEDLQRYRRQFVVGARREPVSAVEPDEAERKRGAMLFAPPADEARLAGWRPTATDRASGLSMVAAPGGRAMTIIAMVPLDETPMAMGSVMPLRSAEGRSLPVVREETRVLAIRRVPRVWSGRVEWLPWLLTDRHESLGEREIALMAVVVQPAEQAAAGTYTGAVRIVAGRTTVQLPLEVEILDTGPARGERTWTAAAEQVTAEDLYHTLAGALPKAQQDALTARLQKFVVASGLGSTMLPAPVIARRDRLYDAGIIQALRLAPLREFTAPTLIETSYALRRLQWSKVPVGSIRYRNLLRRIISSADSLSQRSGLRQTYHYVGIPWRSSGLDQDVRQMQQIAEAGGRPTLVVLSHLLDPSDEQRFRRVIQPMAALIVEPRDARTAELRRLHERLGGERPFVITTPRPDRFMVGLLPALLDADGCYVRGLFMAGSPYGGFDVGTQGMFVPQPDGSFGLTVMAMDLWQGMEDRRLVEQARATAQAARAAGKPAAEIDSILAEAGKQAEDYRPRWDRQRLRYQSPLPSELNALREKLLRATAAVAERL